jgi:DNA repair exonuclease SbcCD ATPase subunit
MKALETLSATSGAQVILISHVASLRERVDARVAVQPLGGGRSEARIDT